MSIRTPRLDNLPKMKFREFLDSLEDNTVYKVEVAFHKNNVVHEAILITANCKGFHEILCSTGYENCQKLKSVYYIKVLEELTKVK